MVDVVDPATRSRMMAGIRAKNTKPELLVRSYLHGRGLRFRLHVKTLPGKPDIVLPKYRAIVFVHGCFWHHHQGCKYAYVPNSRPDFWMQKLSQNAVRDREKANMLIKSGWRVFTVWECELRKDPPRLDALYNEITQGTIDDATHVVE